MSSHIKEIFSSAAYLGESQLLSDLSLSMRSIQDETICFQVPLFISDDASLYEFTNLVGDPKPLVKLTNSSSFDRIDNGAKIVTANVANFTNTFTSYTATPIYTDKVAEVCSSENLSYDSFSKTTTCLVDYLDDLKLSDYQHDDASHFSLNRSYFHSISLYSFMGDHLDNKCESTRWNKMYKLTLLSNQKSKTMEG